MRSSALLFFPFEEPEKRCNEVPTKDIEKNLLFYETVHSILIAYGLFNYLDLHLLLTKFNEVSLTFKSMAFLLFFVANKNEILVANCHKILYNTLLYLMML